MRLRRVFVWILVLASLAVVVTGLGGCRGQAQADTSITISLAVLPDPPVVGPATVTATITDSAGIPVKGAKVEIEGNMSHAGMVPVIVQAEEVRDGVYEGRDFRFTMPGDWLITVRATAADGRSAEHSFTISGVAGEHQAEKGGH